MTILTDIAAAVGELKKTMGMLSRHKDSVLNPKGDFGNGDQRFFERPIDSLARAAKKSILFYPVVASESLSPETVTMLARLVQVRAGEYTKLFIANMDAIRADESGKGAVLSALRGATLKDAAYMESADELAIYVTRNVVRLSEHHDYAEDTLCRPLEESKENSLRKRYEIPRPTASNTDSALLRDKNAVDASNDTEDLHRRRLAAETRLANDAMRQAAEAAAELKRAQDRNVDLNVQVAAARSDAQEAAKRVADLQQQIDSLSASGGQAKQQAEDLARRLEAARQHRISADQSVSDLQQQLRSTSSSEQQYKGQAERLSQRLDAAEAEKAKLTKEQAEAREAKIDACIRAANQGNHKDAFKLAMELRATDGGAGLERLRNIKTTAAVMKTIDNLPEDFEAEEVVRVDRSNTVAASWSAKDFDKLTQVLPLTLNLTIEYNVGNRISQTPLALGIKAVGHIVPSLDLVTGLGTALQRDSLVLQFLRLTSGETSFVKDFVLNLDVAKSRASGRTSGGTKVLETLRRQSEWNTRRGNAVVAMMSKRGFVPPTTTIIITSDEADRIRSIYGVDFTKAVVARDLMRSHNLMGFMIVDEAIGLVRIFEDGDDDFDRVPFSEVKTKGKESSVKDILTIMGRT